MVRNHSLIWIFLTTVLILACGFPSASTSPTLAPEQPAEIASTAALPGLSMDQIKNTQYPALVPGDGRVVQLTDGVFQNNSDPSGVENAYISVTDFFALGDVTGDGVGDAVVLFLENYGGSGNFAVLAVYANVAGQPVFLDSTLIDDRPQPNSVTIQNGEIVVDATVHDFDDGGCCPTMPMISNFVLVKNKLRLVHYVANAANGVPREIQITSPADGVESTDRALHVTGTVSIAPFENNLSYFIYDEDGNQYMAGPITVQAPDLGAPGTFDETFNLSELPAGVFYLEIQDQDAQFGAVLALDSLKFVVK